MGGDSVETGGTWKWVLLVLAGLGDYVAQVDIEDIDHPPAHFRFKALHKFGVNVIPGPKPALEVPNALPPAPIAEYVVRPWIYNQFDPPAVRSTGMMNMHGVVMMTRLESEMVGLVEDLIAGRVPKEGVKPAGEAEVAAAARMAKMQRALNLRAKFGGKL